MNDKIILGNVIQVFFASYKTQTTIIFGNITITRINSSVLNASNNTETFNSSNFITGKFSYNSLNKFNF